MIQQSKMRVAVLYGGRSAEHEVSLRTAASIIQHLDKNLFDVVPVGINKQGQWYLGQDIFDRSLADNHMPQLLADIPTWFTPEWLSRAVPTLPAITSDKQFDVIFPAVHGTMCEDGTLQGLLEQAEVPYVGCNVLASAIGMEKDISKRLASYAGIPIPKFLVIHENTWLQNKIAFITNVENNLGFPAFVKPANTGSSIGVSKVYTREELTTAIETSFRFDTKVVVEEGLDAYEIEVAVLESFTAYDDPIVSVVGEIKPNHAFYNYEAKYLDPAGAELIIPAKLDPKIIAQAQLLAKKIFITLACEGMARVDLFVDKKTHEVIFNEINTLPGFTHISMYPKLMAATGINYKDLLTHLIQLAIKRHARKSQLIRNYAG